MSFRRPSISIPDQASTASTTSSVKISCAHSHKHQLSSPTSKHTVQLVLTSTLHCLIIALLHAFLTIELKVSFMALPLVCEELFAGRSRIMLSVRLIQVVVSGCHMRRNQPSYICRSSRSAVSSRGSFSLLIRQSQPLKHPVHPEGVERSLKDCV